MTAYRRLLTISTLLAFGVITLGAWVRLNDAGLGCPDWPGCYGQWLGVPERAINVGRAWKEMIHRYFAGTLGIAIFALCLLSWRQRRSPVLPAALAGIVLFQALLGMWTVTLLLKPLVVSAHLLGGMTILALLVWLNLRQGESSAPPSMSGRVKTLAAAACLLVALQIALGGWVSSNYAAFACPDFPVCQGQWLPAMDFGCAFSLHRELGRTTSGEPLSLEALTAIHWSHRLGAGLVAVAAGGLGFALVRHPGWRSWGRLLLMLLSLQIGLGIANVLLPLPLLLGVAHNAGAALLLASILAINFRLWAAGGSD